MDHWAGDLRASRACCSSCGGLTASSPAGGLPRLQDLSQGGMASIHRFGMGAAVPAVVTKQDAFIGWGLDDATNSVPPESARSACYFQHGQSLLPCLRRQTSSFLIPAVFAKVR